MFNLDIKMLGGRRVNSVFVGLIYLKRLRKKSDQP